MVHEHDSGYKDLFSHPQMVRDLLTEFVPGDWVKRLDFDTLAKMNASYVADHGQTRHDDMVWEVAMDGETPHLYVLLEFQSVPDRWMALRMLTYGGLFCQDLIKSSAQVPENKIPWLLPIVVYNGASRWTAATGTDALRVTAPDGLRALQPSLQYILIDEGAYDPQVLSDKRNLAAALFWLERSQSVAELRHVIVKVMGWLQGKEHEALRQALKRWILRLLRRKFRSVPEVADLLEVDSMLAETIDRWAEEWKRQGLEEGQRRGLEEGKRKGIEGLARLLHRQLERRFDFIPRWVDEKLAQANEEDLVRWGERIVDARTLDDVFGCAR